jgi:hypothetical protein
MKIEHLSICKVKIAKNNLDVVVFSLLGGTLRVFFVIFGKRGKEGWKALTYTVPNFMP